MRRNVMIAIGLLLSCLFMFGCSSNTATVISLSQMKKIHEKGVATIVDARLDSQWDDNERIPGARGISLQSSDGEIMAALPDKDTEIVIYGGSRISSMGSTLATRLIRLGYTDVSEYTGGLQTWKAAGYVVEMLD
ncbi:MAG: hypothetical protein HRT88_05905 [Lentisphaeraceae bacterium]|nr:hypothetical protein [Lentisphaeraceae bacterium]